MTDTSAKTRHPENSWFCHQCKVEVYSTRCKHCGNTPIQATSPAPRPATTTAPVYAVLEHHADQDIIEGMRFAMHEVDCPHKAALSIRDIELLAQAAYSVVSPRIAALEAEVARLRGVLNTARVAFLHQRNIAPDDMKAKLMEYADVMLEALAHKYNQGGER